MKAAVETKETDEQIKRRTKAMGSKNHSVLQFNIILALGSKYRGIYKIIPELSIIINDKEKIPDLSFYKNIKSTPGNDTLKMTQLPLGVVEILSPTQSLNELVVKAKDYFEAGIGSYWLVAPEVETIYVYSAINEKGVYSKRDTLIDQQLNIELDLSTVFDG